MVKHLPAVQEMQATRDRFLSQEDPLEKEMAAPSSILSWAFLWTEAPESCSPWGCKESAVTECTHRMWI